MSGMEVFFGIGALALAVALVWAMTHNRRGPAGEAMSEAAARDLYRQPLAPDTAARKEKLPSGTLPPV